MRLARGTTDAGQVVLARIEDESFVVVATEGDHPAADVLREALSRGDDLDATGSRRPLSELTRLSPLANPSKILCVGLNYAAHAAESGYEAPAAPVIFAKAPTSLIGPGQPVVFRSDDTTQVDYEAELAVVIGRTTRDIGEDHALDAVLGYTLANDVSARDAQFSDGQWLRGKSYDTFCPLGPHIVTPDEISDVQALGIRCVVNGDVLQEDTTAHMIYPVSALIAYLSRFMTLLPGDLILTGTPDGVGFARTPPVFLHDGDVVRVDIDRLGSLENPIRER
jgi:2-keto-4-pentenoate hydratase/2-oxohepta-3-ene-1,7-dioic acid hydratase in catechol pathway